MSSTLSPTRSAVLASCPDHLSAASNRFGLGFSVPFISRTHLEGDAYRPVRAREDGLVRTRILGAHGGGVQAAEPRGAADAGEPPRTRLW
jgi:hypothetical protein